MSSLVFFGAGASKPFGIPTMQEMVAEFEEKLSEDATVFEFYSKIKKVLIKEYGNSDIDIESILSVINGIAANTNPSELGHFVFYYVSNNCSDNKFSEDKVETAKKLQKQLQNYIKDVCAVKISDDRINKIYDKSYMPLFKHIQGEKGNYGGVKLTQEWKAYTTNYDNIFEDFWNAFNTPVDHFETEGNSTTYVFINKSLQNRSFCKLHGSLDWTKEIETDRIVRKNPLGYAINETKGEIMLFPIQQKDLYLHPWFTLFQDLKSGLLEKQHWYVVGYAFNDEFIRNVFQESLINNDKKLIIINPEAEQVKNKFPDSIKEKIDALPIKFGDEFFSLQFTDYLDGVKTLVVRFVGNRLDIKCNKIITSVKILNEMSSIGDVNPEDVVELRNSNYVLFNMNNPKCVEIKLEIKIKHAYADEIELTMSNDTKKLDFGIDYGSSVIANSHEIKDYEQIHERIWMKEPIKLDKTKLYIHS